MTVSVNSCHAGLFLNEILDTSGNLEGACTWDPGCSGLSDTITYLGTHPTLGGPYWEGNIPIATISGWGGGKLQFGCSPSGWWADDTVANFGSTLVSFVASPFTIIFDLGLPTDDCGTGGCGAYRVTITEPPSVPETPTFTRVTRIALSVPAIPTKVRLMDAVTVLDEPLPFRYGPVLSEAVAAIEGPPGSYRFSSDAVTSSDLTAAAVAVTALSELISAVEALSAIYGFRPEDFVFLTDLLQAQVEHHLGDTVSSFETYFGLEPWKESVGLLDSLAVHLGAGDFVTARDDLSLWWSMVEAVGSTDQISFQIAKAFADEVTSVTRTFIEATVPLSDLVVVTDTLVPGFFRTLVDSVTVQDLIYYAVGVKITDQIQAVDLLSLAAVALTIDCQVELDGGETRVTLEDATTRVELDSGAGRVELERC